MQTVRIDDYPSGNPGYDIQESRAVLRKALGIFEAQGVPYMLGVSPLLMDGEDIAFLNEVVKTGHVVMHGHSHFFEYQDWSRITDTWPHGGEYMGMSHGDIRKVYQWGQKLLSLVNRYDRTEFVPPFNTFTQNAVDVFCEMGVKRLHTCSKEFDLYGYSKMDFHGMDVVVSPYQTTYDYAHKVLEYLTKNPDDKSQITLHWIFDKDHNGWEDAYRNLCRWIVQHG